MKFTSAVVAIAATANAIDQYNSGAYYGSGYERPVYKQSPVPKETTYAKCMMKDPEEEVLFGGAINFKQDPYGDTEVWGNLWGAKPGVHGFHVHTLGDLSGGCESLAGHYDPTMEMARGGLPLGDLNDAIADANGDVHISQSRTGLFLYGEDSIIGRSLVFHAVKDENGMGGADRVGCCVIGLTSGPVGYGYGGPAY